MCDTAFDEQYGLADSSVDGLLSTRPLRWISSKTDRVSGVHSPQEVNPVSQHHNEVTSLQTVHNQKVARLAGAPEVLQRRNVAPSVSAENSDFETLQAYTQTDTFSQLPQCKREELVLEVAAHLVQSLTQSHSCAGVAYVSLSPKVVLVQRSGLGIKAITIADAPSQPTTTWVTDKKALAHEYDMNYAAPEVVGPGHSRRGGMAMDTKDYLVNGSAADVYSVGAILYELLTGRSPFQPHFGYSLEFVREKFIIRSQKLWGSALNASKDTDQPIHHSLLAEVESKSANPGGAADFFCKMLHLKPEQRMPILEARYHPYLEEAITRLELQQAASAAHPVTFTAAGPSPFKDITNAFASVNKSSAPLVKSDSSSGGQKHTASAASSAALTSPSQTALPAPDSIEQPCSTASPSASTRPLVSHILEDEYDDASDDGEAPDDEASSTLSDKADILPCNSPNTVTVGHASCDTSPDSASAAMTGVDAPATKSAASTPRPMTPGITTELDSILGDSTAHVVPTSIPMAEAVDCTSVDSADADLQDELDSSHREPKRSKGRAPWWSKGLRCLKKHKKAILIGTATVIGVALAKRK